MAEERVDRELKCVDCGNSFPFTAGEQEFFAEMGFTNVPKRCKPCRAVKKQRVERASIEDGERVDFPISCASCGAADTIPFTPREGRPVYCRKCFKAEGRSV